jgi:hypothetical protein
MPKQRRWLCKECKREWHDIYQTNANYGQYFNSSPCSITGNPPGSNCPVCGSPEIVEVIYTPPYPGLDIPRDQPLEVIPQGKVVASIPGLTGHTNFTMREDTPKEFKIKSDTPLPARVAVADTPKVLSDEEYDKLHEDRSEIYDISDMD